MCPPKYAEPLQADSASGGSNSDSGLSDLDSIYDSEEASITDTLKSSWIPRMNKFVHGRRYHTHDTEKTYYVPNDEEQQDQLDLFHSIYTKAISTPEEPAKLFVAPIASKPQRVLDVGTGTGIWAIDFADEYSSAEVIGFDITPIQPRWVPPNCNFEVEDVERDWTYTTDSFDFVHARAMHAVIKDWKKFCINAHRVVKPGGYLEVFNEVAISCSDDNTIPKDWAVVKWLNLINEALSKLGIPMFNHETIQKDMEEAGFEDIHQEWFKVPVGPWPKDRKMKELGAMFMINMLQGIEGWSTILMTQILGWELDKTKDFIDEVKKCIRNKKVHSYMRFQCTYGRKPSTGAQESGHTQQVHQQAS